MEFLGLKIVGFVLYTAFVWFIGRKWNQYNSVSDIEVVFKDISSKFEAIKTDVGVAAKAAEDKAAALKALL